MKINLFDLKRQISPLRKAFIKSFEKVLDTNEFTYGEQTRILEKNFAEFVNCKYALGVRSGTAALIVALKALGLQKDDEVITTPMTFSATSDAIIHAGAKVVFADIDLKTGNLDPESIKKVKTKRTKAILVVHFAGLPCEMTKIVSFCKKNKLFLIEDASHAHGSIYKNKKVGSFGDFACFSFYPSKAFGSLGNAGIITTNKKKLLKNAQMFAEHGLYGKKYKHRLVGYNEKIDNLQSAFLNVKFPLLEGWVDKRLEIAKKYQEVFSKKGVRTIAWPDYSRPSLYIFSIFIKNREKFAKYLLENGVGSGTYYPIALHLQESLKFLNYKKGDFPNAELYAEQTLAIPFYPELTNQEIDFICDLIEKYKF